MIGKFKLELTLGDAAMSTDNDIASALEGVAARMRATQYMQGQDEITRGIIDENGNHVGEWHLTWEE